jgi:putative hemolysin
MNASHESTSFQSSSVVASRPAGGPGVFNTLNPSLPLRLLQRYAGIPELEALYPRVEAAQRPGESYYCALLRVLGVQWSISDLDLDRIPKAGACLLVANHPFGMIEGTVLGALLEGVRPDVRIMANSLMGHFPKVAEKCILVDPFGGEGARQSNRKSMREAFEWLRRDGLLVVFPAGEVASFDAGKRIVTDPPWNTGIVRMATRVKAPVVPVFFDGSNGLGFQVAGMVHPRLRTVLLTREFLNKSGKTLVLRVGNLVRPKKLESFASDVERTDYLRRKTFVLANRQEPKQPPPFLCVPLRERFGKAWPKEELAPIVAATDPEQMEREIHGLDPAALLDQQGDNQVYIVAANRIPNVVREIGRLREITFRQTGEGTGKSIDLDEFDTYYLHLFIWNRAARGVVGAYRLGQSDRILQNFGIKGFYTATLFSYHRAFIEQVNPALEMGRSFVRAEYQRSYAPLLLLWRGIGVYARQNPQYKMLFGPVSISNDYHPNSRELMVSFLKQYCRAEDLEHFVRARSPFRTRPMHRRENVLDSGMAWDIEELSTFIADIETDQKGVPVLLKQYLKLGGKLLGFNIDSHFSKALDGLIVVDLVKTDPRLLDRYMGKAGAAAFLAYHQGQVAEAR